MISKNKILENKFNKLSEKFVYKNTFKPTYTTLSMIKILNNLNLKKKNILDLGCGSGIITSCIYNKKFNSNFFLSDLSLDAARSAKINLKSQKIVSELKVGNCFKPWKNQKFDLIINDVSGVSKVVSKISPWFKKIPIDKSDNGNYFLKKVLKESPDYLCKNALIVTPIISLSKVSESISYIKKKYNIIKYEKFEWPLPKEMKRYEKLLKSYKSKKIIDFEFKFGTIICYTLILVLKIK